MIIKSKDVKVFWINDKDNQKRYEHMTTILNKYFPNHERINAVYDKPKYNGVTLAHLNAILKGISLKKPFIVLEDDVTIKNYKEEWSIDDSIDAIFMGISCWGNKSYNKDKINKTRIENDKIFFCNGAKGTILQDSEYFRVDSMYGAHAILYINPKYMISAVKNCLQAYLKSKPHDIYFPRQQKKYNIYGLTRPIFFQSRKLGGQEKFTNVEVEINETERV